MTLINKNISKNSHERRLLLPQESQTGLSKSCFGTSSSPYNHIPFPYTLRQDAHKNGVVCLSYKLSDEIRIKPGESYFFELYNDGHTCRSNKSCAGIAFSPYGPLKSKPEINASKIGEKTKLMKDKKTLTYDSKVFIENISKDTLCLNRRMTLEIRNTDRNKVDVIKYKPHKKERSPPPVLENKRSYGKMIFFLCAGLVCIALVAFLGMAFFALHPLIGGLAGCAFVCVVAFIYWTLSLSKCPDH